MKIAAMVIASLCVGDAKQNRHRRHVGESRGRIRHRRNEPNLPKYSFKIHKDAVDANGKAGLSSRSFLNIKKEDKKMIKTLSDAGARRYIHLKKMMDYMFQNVNTTSPAMEQFFGYGCWCVAHGENPLLAKRGLPADEIDSVCKDHALCYECARLDYGHKCDATQKDYTVIANQDLVTGEHYLTCSNEDVCQQTICECDKMLVEGLAKKAHTWNEELHINKSGFNGKEKCELPEPIHDWGQLDQCCGEYPNRAPFRSDNGNRQCCGNKTYHTFYLECCDGDVKQKGFCSAGSPNDIPEDQNSISQGQ
jgi:hypothetical protein